VVIVVAVVCQHCRGQNVGQRQKKQATIENLNQVRANLPVLMVAYERVIVKGGGVADCTSEHGSEPLDAAA
jgi:hypothetical protein